MSKRKIDELGLSEGLDLVTVPKKDTSEASAKYVRYYPRNTLSEENPIEFEIMSDDFVDLSASRLHLRVELQRVDGVALSIEVSEKTTGRIITQGDYPTPVNDLFDAIFQYCKMSIGDSEMEEMYNLYAYAAYIHLLTTSTKAEQDTTLKTQWWSKDDPANMNFVWKGDKTVKAQGDAFKDYDHDKGRWFFMFQAISGKMWISGRPACDLFHQKRYIPENSRITLRLIQQINPAFWYLARLDRKYKIVIDQAFLDVRVVKSSPGVKTYYKAALEHTPAYYAVSRKIALPFGIRKGEHSIVIQDPTRGRFPTKVLVGFVDEAAFNGDREKNPWNFENVDITSLQLVVNGQTFRSAFASTQLAVNYSALFERGAQPNITMEEFGSGTTLYAFHPENADEPTSVTTQLIISFKTALTKNFKLIFYFECEDAIHI